MDIFELQRKLKALGYDPGPVDGIRGRRTIRAVKAFQRDMGLVPDGIVGRQTSAAIKRQSEDDDRNPYSYEPQPVPWYDEAYRLLGTKEVVGRGSNPTILDWAEPFDINYPDDDIPWCGLFVGHCIGSQLPDEILPGNILGARNWRNFGKATSPKIGSILVFWRGSPQGWKGHVGFYAGETDRHFLVLGGNQSNSVSVARISKGRLLDSRWPVTGPSSEESSHLFIVEGSGSPAISHNEA